MTLNFFRLWVSDGGGEGLKSSASRGCARGAWGLEGYEAMGLGVWRCVVDDGDDVGLATVFIASVEK